MKKIIYTSLAIVAIAFFSCDRENFAELNSDPSSLSEPELRFSTAKTIELMYNNDYTVWFYNNFDYVFPWSQLTGTGVGNSEDFVQMGPYNNQVLYPLLYSNIRDIRHRIEALSAEEQASFSAIKAMTVPILIQPYITVTDNQGSLPYEEAALAPFTTPSLLTPVYDSQEKMFNAWLEELDEAIINLTKSNQLKIANQDVIYGGDYLKWAKFCNLLKLKIAARLINKDKTKALQVAEEVVNSPVGYMDNLEDDFIYRRSKNYFGTGNGTQPGTGGKNIIDFLIVNKDPRVRYLFTKNGFNAEVVQAFIDAERDLPSYIEQYVVKDTDGNFANWEAPGEPWVRYFGAPLSPDKRFDTNNDSYFKQSELNKITIDGVEKTYSSTSSYSERLTRTRINHTYPTKPGGRIIEKKDNYPAFHVILGSSAETNLYLAEFKLLGANISGTAQDYFNRGVELSIKRMDALAANNGQPYYEEDPVYTDAAEAEIASTKLKSNEIADLLTQPAYDLGSDALEKVYIQQYINFAATPGDLWTLVRRSGIPKTGSLYLPREPFLASGSELTIPRRFVIETPTSDDANYQNHLKAIEEQGFTTGTNSPSTLNNERIWFDKENPNYGSGPN